MPITFGFFGMPSSGKTAVVKLLLDEYLNKKISIIKYSMDISDDNTSDIDCYLINNRCALPITLIDLPSFGYYNYLNSANDSNILDNIDVLFWILDINRACVSKDEITFIRRYYHKSIYLIFTHMDAYSSSEIESSVSNMKNSIKIGQINFDGVFNKTASTCIEDNGRYSLYEFINSYQENPFASCGTHTIAVVGGCKSGKSTFINALLGENILLSATTPVSCVPVHIRYGQEHRVFVSFISADAKNKYFKDEKKDNYLSQTLIEIDINELNEFSTFGGKYSSLVDSVYVFYNKPELINQHFIEFPYDYNKYQFFANKHQELIHNADKVLLMINPSNNKEIDAAISKFSTLIENFSGELIVCVNKFDLLFHSKEDFCLENEYSQKVAPKNINIGEPINTPKAARVVYFSSEAALLSRLPFEVITRNEIYNYSWKELSESFMCNSQSKMYEKSKFGQIEKMIYCGEKSNFEGNTEDPIGHNDEHEFLLSNFSPQMRKNVCDGEKKFTINNSTISVISGDITHSCSQVIVSSDNNYLTMSGGVSYEIQQKGKYILSETKKFVPARLGDVIITTAGVLEQRYIFHCITIDEQREKDIIENSLSDEDTQTYILQHTVDKCFQLMHLLELSSIAFPVIGSGSAMIPFSRVLEQLAICIARNLENTNRNLDIEIYLDERNMHPEAEYHSFFSLLSAQEAISKYKAKLSSRIIAGTMPKSDINSICQETHDVFISYSRQDKEIAEYICSILNDKGINYWIDKEGIYSSVNYKEVIVDAIDTAKAIIFISSVNSNSSNYVIREIGYSVNKEKPILPIMVDEMPFAKSISFDISDIDQIEFSYSEEFKRRLTMSLLYALS